MITRTLNPMSFPCPFPGQRNKKPRSPSIRNNVMAFGTSLNNQITHSSETKKNRSQPCYGLSVWWIQWSSLLFLRPFSIAAFRFLDLKAYLLSGLFGRCHKLLNGLKYSLDTLIMTSQPRLYLMEFSSELFLGWGYFSELYESPHNSNVDFNSSIAV